jgi:tetratricopeptide (TPR) repeat protein
VLLQQQINETAAERDAKVEQQRQARRAVDDMYTAVAEQWLANQPRLQALQREFLEKALVYYQQAASEDGSDPDIKAQTAASLRRVGAIQTALGRPEQAKQALGRAIGELEPLTARFPTRADYLRQLAECYNELGAAHLKSASLGDAASAYQRALELWKNQILDTPQLSEQRQAALATIQGNLAWVLTNAGKTREAEEHYRTAFSGLAKVVAQHPGDRKLRMSLAWAHNNRGNLFQNLGRYQDAARNYQEAVTLFKKLVDDFPTAPDCRDGWASALSNLGQALERSGQRGEAIGRTRQAAAILERLTRDYPDVVDYSFELGGTLGNLGTSLSNNSNGEEADAILRRAGVVFQQLLQAHPDIPQYANDLAINERHRADLLARLLKRPADAEKAYQRAIDIGQKLVTHFPGTATFRSDLALSHAKLGVLHCTSGRLQPGEAALRAALRIQERLVADDPANAFYQDTLREIRLNLTTTLVARDPPLSDAAWVVRVLQEELTKNPQRGDCWYWLAVARYRLDDAEGTIDAIKKAHQAHFQYGRVGTLYFIMALWKHGDREDARKMYEMLLQAIERQHATVTEKERRLRAEAGKLLGIQEQPSQ